MKKPILKTKGYFIGNVFIVTHMKVTEEEVNSIYNDGKNLQVGYAPYTQDGETCGGVNKPDKPEGQVGDYFCIANEWVWFPG